MPRRGIVSKRETVPDIRYNDTIVTKFINTLMKKGKKSLAESIFYGAMDIIQQKTNQDPMQVFKQALNNVKPIIEVKSRRVGGSTYQVPVEIRSERRVSLAIRWIVDFAKKRSEKNMREALAGELIDAAAGKGASVKKREDTHKMAEANKAFAHYKW
ncbi:MAG: 30S ribosomal protein S7 [bacterium]|nr:30S ribosomal protein S7 [bacterium]